MHPAPVFSLTLWRRVACTVRHGWAVELSADLLASMGCNRTLGGRWHLEWQHAVARVDDNIALHARNAKRVRRNEGHRGWSSQPLEGWLGCVEELRVGGPQLVAG